MDRNEDKTVYGPDIGKTVSDLRLTASTYIPEDVHIYMSELPTVFQRPSKPHRTEHALFDNRYVSNTLGGTATPHLHPGVCSRVSSSNDDHENARSEDMRDHLRSTRARRAANQRHVKNQKSRVGQKQACGCADGPVGKADIIHSDSDKRRERNREAASKCRAKKKQKANDLEDAYRKEQAKNSVLKRKVMELRDELSTTRMVALLHDAANGCQCFGIHQYNFRKAMELVSSLPDASKNIDRPGLAYP